MIIPSLPMTYDDEYEAGTNAVTAFAVLNDKLITAAQHGTPDKDDNVRVWNLPQATYKALQIGHRVVNDLAVQADGFLTACGPGGPPRPHAIMHWNQTPPNGGAGFPDCSPSVDHKKDVTVLATSLSSNSFAVLASGSNDKKIKLWGPTGKWRGDFEGHTDYLLDLHYFSDNTTLASSAQDKTIKTWNPHYSKPLRDLHRQFNCRALAIRTNDWLLAGCGCNLELWDIRDPNKDNPDVFFSEHQADVIALDFLSDNIAVSASWDNTIKFWDISKNASLATLENIGQLSTLKILPDKTMVVGLMNGKFKHFIYETGS